jgi:hypothetical protein
MISSLSSLGRFRPCLLAVLIVCTLPVIAPESMAGQARAETLVFRNEVRHPMVVQVATVVRGVVYRDKPYLLRYGDSTPKIKIQGDKIVTVYDGKIPNRILFQGAIKAGKVDLYYGIVPGLPGKVRMEPRTPPRMERD